MERRLHSRLWQYGGEAKVNFAKRKSGGFIRTGLG